MESDLIYDVGMNNGDDTAYYLHRGYRVVAIEADPTLVDKAHDRFAREIEAGRLTLVNAAIGPEEGKATFWICEGKSEWNSFDRAVASRMGRAHHPIEVQCCRFRQIWHKYKVPYYLKIDIEGHDHYCAADIDPLDAPKYVSLELDKLEHLVLLSEKGYNAFKIITQNDFSRLSARPPSLKQSLKKNLQKIPGVYAVVDTLSSLKGKAVRMLQANHQASNRPQKGDWSFPIGSSGPFGEETDGEWQSLDEAAYAWLHYRLGLSEYGPPSLSTWHDVHATRR